MERGVLDLPCGERLGAGGGFRCIALGHPMGGEWEWVAPEVAGMFHFVHVDLLPRDELTEVLAGLYPELEGSELLEQIVGLKDRWVGRRIRWTGGRGLRSRCGRSGTCAGGWGGGGGGGGQWGFIASYSRRADDGSAVFARFAGSAWYLVIGRLTGRDGTCRDVTVRDGK